jgi:hypothetical protein
MTTRRQIIETLYNQFQEEIMQQLGNTIFPSLEEMDLAEILIIFNTTFSYTDDYKYVVNELIKSKKELKISKDEFEKVYPTIEKFINEFKRIQN